MTRHAIHNPNPNLQLFFSVHLITFLFWLQVRARLERRSATTA
jgi:hypothetical protein